MGLQRHILAADTELAWVANELTDWLTKEHGLEVQQLRTDTDGYLIQARSANWKSYAALAVTQDTRLECRDPYVDVTIGSGRWADKALGITAGAIAAVPSGGLGLTIAGVSAVGAWKQYKLPRDTLAFVEQSIERHKSSEVDDNGANDRARRKHPKDMREEKPPDLVGSEFDV